MTKQWANNHPLQLWADGQITTKDCILILGLPEDTTTERIDNLWANGPKGGGVR